MESESNTDIKRLRTQAGRLGIAIRKQRASGTSPSGAYRLIDRDTGRVIYKDVALDDIRTRLWMMSYRQRATIAPFRAPQAALDDQAAIRPSLDPVASDGPSRVRTREGWAPTLYLVGIAGAETAARTGQPWLGVSLYAFILVASLNQAAASSRPVRILLLAVALVSVERLLGYTEPLIALGRSYEYVAVAVPTLVGIALVARLARYSRRDLGLLIDRRVAGISLALTLPSVAVGYVFSDVVRPVALDGEPGIAGVVVSWTLLALTTGLVEEMLFRGLLQRAAFDCFGPLPAILYVAVLYTLLASVTWNGVGIAVVFTIALALAALTTYTRSVIPAAAAHASLNVGVVLAAASFIAGVGLH